MDKAPIIPRDKAMLFAIVFVMTYVMSGKTRNETLLRTQPER